MSEFTRYLIEVFEQFGTVSARKMFGGYGLYHQGLMFGLVYDDTLYLKADAATAQQFESQGLSQFTYLKAGKQVSLSYYLAPAEVLDDPEQAAIWARQSFEAACRSGARRGRHTIKS
jgi:DNA transformation protein and related proteins